MAIGSTMTKARQNQIIADVEKAGLKARRTKHGIMIQAKDGTSRTINTMSDGSQGLRGDIAWFREHGLTHPADKHKHDKPKEAEVARPAETNEEGYPLYMVGPINGTTRKRVLANLESKGWPLRIMATDINMDTVTASRALYAVGYRWDPTSHPRKRVWVAPDDIREMHEKVKAEMKRREEEARAERQERTVTIEPGAIVIAGTADPEETAKRVVEAIPEVVEGRAEEAERLLNEAMAERNSDPAITKPGLRLVGEAPSLAPQPEREFIDSVDSWTVTEADAPLAVREYLRGLRAAGLEAEIRAWRKS